MNYYNKYLKYKNKYINLTNMIGSGNDKPSCPQCINPNVVSHIYDWHHRSCDKCLTKTSILSFGKKLSKDAIQAQSYKDNLVQQCIDIPNLRLSDKCFYSIPDYIRTDVNKLINDLSLNELSKTGHNKLIDYYTNNPLVLKYINVIMKNHCINNSTSSVIIDTDIYRPKYELYRMKYDEDNLPIYPSEGSIEKKFLKDYLLDHKKNVYYKNTEVLRYIIKNNKMGVINHSILEKYKDLLEFVNTYMLAYYKENPKAIYGNDVLHMMKYDENNLPPYPSEGSVQREEMKKLILLTQKEVYEQNRHKIKELIEQNNDKKINSLIIKDKDLLEFVNTHMLAYYKENPKFLMRTMNFSYNFFESKYMGYIMNYTDKILPAYPSEGSVEREKMHEIILSAKKWAEEKNIEIIETYIKDGKDINMIIYSDIYEDKNLVDFLNKYAIDHYKKNPSALTKTKGVTIYSPSSITFNIYQMKYLRFFPRYPIIDYADNKEMPEIILSAKKWVQEKNIEIISEYINSGYNIQSIEYSDINRDKYLLEIVNKIALDEIKKDPLKTLLFNNAPPPGSKYMMKYTSSSLPKFPTKESIEIEEVKKIILSTEKWVEEENKKLAIIK